MMSKNYKLLVSLVFLKACGNCEFLDRRIQLFESEPRSLILLEKYYYQIIPLNQRGNDWGYIMISFRNNVAQECIAAESAQLNAFGAFTVTVGCFLFHHINSNTSTCRYRSITSELYRELYIKYIVSLHTDIFFVKSLIFGVGLVKMKQFFFIVPNPE